MTLTADSGSTKTTWAVVETGSKYVTEGLNPHFTIDNWVLRTCGEVRKHFKTSPYGTTLYFYGAGCGNSSQRARMRELLSEGFMTDDVTVEGDMLGACRAVAGDNATLVGILGTGSNACYYDGERIAFQRPSLGYILGDEGSANAVGRRLLKDYYSEEMMGQEVRAMFHDTYPYQLDEWIEAVYHRPNANRFLAQLARFAVEHGDRQYCKKIIKENIDEWHTMQLKPLITKTSCNEIGIVGGYAHAIERQLREELIELNVKVGDILADPIDGLIQYHRRHSKNS